MKITPLVIGLIVSSSLVAAAVSPAPVIKVTGFDLAQVRLLDSPFKRAQELDHQYLLSLDPDRFLLMFRVTAGLDGKGSPLGGWEGPGIEVRGHSLGHYLSACSLMYASTGDPALKKKTDYIVAELAECQKNMPDQGYHAGYLAAFPESFFNRVDTGKPVWAPWYTMHKIMAGLLDTYVHTGNAQALEVVTHLADWVKFRVDRLTPAQMQASLETEHGGMTEVLANLAAVTGQADYLRVAEAFNHHAVFDPLARGQDALDGLHANTQIPKITGVAREYELTGKTEYRDIARFFWQEVALHRSYAIGGHSDDEHFFPVADFLKHLSSVTAETCNTYNMLKLTEHLFAWEPSAGLMDFYERALYNQILASQDPKTGMFEYFISMKPGHFKTYSTPENSFWCCVGTGMENHSKYGEAIYSHDSASLYVNLFIASELSWPELGLVVRQETVFPEAAGSHLQITAHQPVRLALKVRQPAWCGPGIALKVNGAAVATTVDATGYATIDREWHDGDSVEIGLPMALRTETLPGDASTVAVFYGPIVLAGELGTDGLPPGGGSTRDQQDFAKWPTPPVPPLGANAAAVLAGLKPTDGQPLTFKTAVAGRPEGITFIPFYRLHDERYSIYWATGAGKN